MGAMTANCFHRGHRDRKGQVILTCLHHPHSVATDPWVMWPCSLASFCLMNQAYQWLTLYRPWTCHVSNSNFIVVPTAYYVKATTTAVPNAAFMWLVVTPPPLHFTWSVNTDLIFAEGSNKIMLKHQRPLIQKVIIDVIENVQASILFDNTFPDMTLSITFVRDALITAAEGYKPASDRMRQRLMEDENYFSKIAPLVSSTMSL